MTKVTGSGDGNVYAGGVYGAYGTDAIDTLQTIFQMYLQSTTSYKGAQGEDILDGFVPELEAPVPDIDMGDLAGILLKLKNATSETQLKGARDFIEANKTDIKAKHEERIKNIMESLDKAEKAKKTGTITQVFGWVAAAITVIAAVAACIATGGIAIGPCVAAVMAVGMMVMQSTGVMDKAMEGLANALPEDWGMARQIVAAVIITVATLAISLAAPAGVAAAVTKAVGDTAKITAGVVKIATMASMAEKFANIAKVAQYTAKGANIATQVGTGITGAVGGVYQHESLQAQAEAQEIQKFILKLQQAMEAEQDKIKELIEQLQSGVSVVAQIVQTEADTKSRISQKISV